MPTLGSSEDKTVSKIQSSKRFFKKELKWQITRREKIGILHHPTRRNLRQDRLQGNPVRGFPKKGGFRGWGRIGEGDAESPIAVLDPNDPNFVEEEEEGGGGESVKLALFPLPDKPIDDEEAAVAYVDVDVDAEEEAEEDAYAYVSYAEEQWNDDE